MRSLNGSKLITVIVKLYCMRHLDGLGASSQQMVQYTAVLLPGGTTCSVTKLTSDVIRKYHHTFQTDVQFSFRFSC